MRRISWIDQRISCGRLGLGFCWGAPFRFFWRWRISAMSDRGHHGECKHHQGHMTVPAMPGSALVVIEPELVLRGFKAVLDRPSVAFDSDERFNSCSCWAPSGEEGEVIIGDATTDQ